MYDSTKLNARILVYTTIDVHCVQRTHTPTSQNEISVSQFTKVPLRCPKYSKKLAISSKRNDYVNTFLRNVFTFMLIRVLPSSPHTGVPEGGRVDGRLSTKNVCCSAIFKPRKLRNTPLPQDVLLHSWILPISLFAPISYLFIG